MKIATSTHISHVGRDSVQITRAGGCAPWLILCLQLDCHSNTYSRVETNFGSDNLHGIDGLNDAFGALVLAAKVAAMLEGHLGKKFGQVDLRDEFIAREAA